MPDQVRELAEAGANAWDAIEQALDAFGEGSHVLDEEGLLIRLRAAQAQLLPCTKTLSTSQPPLSEGVGSGAEKSWSAGLADALTAVVWPFAATKPGRCPNFEEIPEECDCVACKAVTLLAQWEDSDSAPPQQAVQGEKGKVTKVCPQHGERDQVGIYCNAPMGTRLSCGQELEFRESDCQPEKGGEENDEEALSRVEGERESARACEDEWAREARGIRSAITEWLIDKARAHDSAAIDGRPYQKAGHESAAKAFREAAAHVEDFEFQPPASTEGELGNSSKTFNAASTEGER